MEKTIVKLLDSYESGGLSRRDLICGLTLLAGVSTAAAAPESSPINAVSINHIAINVTDVKRSAEFYRDVFGLKVSLLAETNAALLFGNTGLIIRKSDKPGITHYMFGIDNYNADALAAALKSRGLSPRKDNDSYHVKDPDGMDVQVGDKDMRGPNQAPEGSQHLTKGATKK